MSDKLKPFLAWTTGLLLLFSIWAARYEMATIIFAYILGIAGTLLIFFTEVGYSYRKNGLVKLGSVRTWLRTHILMGIAGPVVIVWHTGLNFWGFAGCLTWLMMVVVASGFVGRYIYRSIPRSIKGQEISLKDLDAQLAAVSAKLDALLAGPLEEKLNREIKDLESERQALRRRIVLLDTSKAALSRWTLFHKPLTLTMFVGILLHAANAAVRTPA